MASPSQNLSDGNKKKATDAINDLKKYAEKQAKKVKSGDTENKHKRRRSQQTSRDHIKILSESGDDMDYQDGTYGFQKSMKQTIIEVNIWWLF